MEETAALPNDPADQNNSWSTAAQRPEDLFLPGKQCFGARDRRPAIKKVMNKKRQIFTILAILWMAAIFFFSSRDADQSTLESNRAGMLLGHCFVQGFDSWPEERQIAFAQKIDHPVRKTAHASEYALLGLLLFGAMAGKTRMRILYSWAASSCYAATDEIHQLFVPGRSAQFTDVCIDSAGASLGILLAAGITCLILQVRRSRKN